MDGGAGDIEQCWVDGGEKNNTQTKQTVRVCLFGVCVDVCVFSWIEYTIIVLLPCGVDGYHTNVYVT